MRLIDADAILDGQGLYSCEELADFVNLLRNAPTITQPPNGPMTLKELLEMDGEPFYYMSLKSKHGEYAILRVINEGCLAQGGGSNKCCANIKTYGTNWIAYRRKPEEGTT